jgi:hypothetical protein
VPDLLHLGSLKPLANPLGFGASDFIEFALAAILVSLTLLRHRLKDAARRLAGNTRWSMLFIGALPILLRLLLLPNSPEPVPTAADDSSYLLLADTLAHFRLANPVHPFHRFFETTFALQQPSYSSIFPMGQGIALALGRLLTGHPWTGVLLSEALFCALCYWMLRGWTRPVWALAGGVLAVFEFGPLSTWMNSYWGGAVSGIAGCLVFGAIPRLRDRYRTREAVLLGLGLGLQMLTRPFESVFLFVAAALFLWDRRGNRALLRKVAPVAALALLPAAALILAQDKAVTGHWTELPYSLSRAQYGIPASFTSEPDPVPQRELTLEQQLDYQDQTEVHDLEASRTYLGRLRGRIRYARFFLLPPLYVALPAVLLCFADLRLLRAAGAILLFALGVTLYPYFYPHYIAAVACLFLLLAIKALDRIPRRAAAMLLLVAAAHFTFWYGIHLFGDSRTLASLEPYESWDFVNRGDPDGRIRILKELHASPGKQLVFVRYGAFHGLREWIMNGADIDHSAIVWALDLGPSEDQTLRAYYPDRTAWLVQPDALPPRLTRMSPSD